KESSGEKYDPRIIDVYFEILERRMGEKAKKEA
ncbi:unnamed protein product, partial [marine sediment metagenome]